MTDPQRRSTVTCPDCGHARAETMPIDACVVVYDCADCGATLRPKSGDCCIFCSYGDVACPPVQVDGRCGDNPPPASRA